MVYCRSPDQFAVSDYEKTSIRETLLSKFDESNDQVQYTIESTVTCIENNWLLFTIC